MNIIVRTLSILLVVDAIFLMVKPQMCKTYFTMLTQGKRIYLMALIYAALGLVFLFGADERCSSEYIIIAFGILALTVGVLIVALPDKAAKFITRLASFTNFTLRLIALVYLLIAAVVVYAS
ncbi:MAG: hypothetical protein K8R02_08580 [Anaerohalosphaeraceae bacterium]|nr:hypothetical protein [Anaerohalosphaeraceae bacterium]